MTPTEAAAALRDPYRCRTQAELDEIAALIDKLARGVDQRVPADMHSEARWRIAELEAQVAAMQAAPTVAHMVRPASDVHQPAIVIDRARAENYAVRTHGVISELIERKHA